MIKNHGHSKNLRAVTKIFGQLQKCSGTSIMFLCILNNYAGQIYNFWTLKKKNGEWKYFQGNKIFLRINTNVYGLFPHIDCHTPHTISISILNAGSRCSCISSSGMLIFFCPLLNNYLLLDCVYGTATRTTMADGYHLWDNEWGLKTHNLHLEFLVCFFFFTFF